MKLSWSPKYEIDTICRQIESYRTAGGFSCSGDFEDYRSLINVAVHLPGDFSSDIKNVIINRGFGRAANSGTLSPKNLLAAIGKEYADWVSQPKASYVLLTRLSALRTSVKRTFRVRTETISLLPAKPASLVQARLQFHWPNGFRGIEVPEDFSWVTVQTRGRGELEAAHRAMESLDYLTGAWNFALNLRTYSQYSSPLPKTVNQLQAGPVHTLHHKSVKGEEGYVAFWYRPDYVEAPKPARLSELEWSKLEEERRWFARTTRNHPYGGQIRDALIRYSDALDQHDRTVAFTKLWSVLEFLTDTIGAKYAELIKRAAFTFADYDLHRQILEMLRDKRNAAVHHGTMPDNDQYTIYQLKRYVEQVLLFHAVNHFRFKSLADAASFLGLSPSRELLKGQIDICKKALKYRR